MEIKKKMAETAVSAMLPAVGLIDWLSTFCCVCSICWTHQTDCHWPRSWTSEL